MLSIPDADHIHFSTRLKLKGILLSLMRLLCENLTHYSLLVQSMILTKKSRSQQEPLDPLYLDLSFAFLTKSLESSNRYSRRYNTSGKFISQVCRKLNP